MKVRLVIAALLMMVGGATVCELSYRFVISYEITDANRSTWKVAFWFHQVAYLIYLLGIVLIFGAWVHTCYKQFQDTGESTAFKDGMHFLFSAVAVAAVGFVVWHFVTDMQKNWRETAELKKATVELLKETKKQNRAAGIK